MAEVDGLFSVALAAACWQCVIGVLPTINARSGNGLDDWLTRIEVVCTDSPNLTLYPIQ